MADFRDVARDRFAPSGDLGELYLERAEGVLFDRFCDEVKAGEYGNARVVVELMQELSIV